MSVTSVNEVPTGRDGVGSAHRPQQGTIRRRWRIETNSSSDNSATIQSDATYQGSGIPLSFGVSHPDNVFFTCRSLAINPMEDSARVWFADATYSNEPLTKEEEERATTPNPIQRLPRFSINGQEYQKYSDKDAEGTAFLNSADVPYPPQILEHSRPILRISMNVSAWTTAWWNYVNPLSKNDDDVKVSDGFSTITIVEETGLLKSLELGQMRTENGISYYPISCEVHIDGVDLWKIELKDQGFVWKSGDNEWARIKVKDSTASGSVSSDLIDTPEEQLLNGSGKPLRWPNGQLSNPAVTEAQYREFERAVQRDFAALPFFTEA